MSDIHTLPQPDDQDRPDTVDEEETLPTGTSVRTKILGIEDNGTVESYNPDTNKYTIFSRGVTVHRSADEITKVEN